MLPKAGPLGGATFLYLSESWAIYLVSLLTVGLSPLASAISQGEHIFSYICSFLLVKYVRFSPSHYILVDICEN
jgi:hypothetical protein